jgi:hypothetical protein
MLDTPCLLVLEALFEVVGMRLVLGGDPEEDVAVVTSRRQDLAYQLLNAITRTCKARHTSRTPSYNIDSLRMFDEGRQIADLSLLPVGFHLPELQLSVKCP